jgi:hypothetical protein
MINKVKEIIKQDMVKALIEKLGYVPLIPSFYGSSKLTPANLIIYCPHCYMEN